MLDPDQNDYRSIVDGISSDNPINPTNECISSPENVLNVSRSHGERLLSTAGQRIKTDIWRGGFRSGALFFDYSSGRDCDYC
ncbi:MAG TPA: hypothetical protein VFW05_15525 [Verrucomicrobiae bacterium]|nr:hypothetical protein [Verrucomicrobiae bacterium]